jgi:hypothetical protein
MRGLEDLQVMTRTYFMHSIVTLSLCLLCWNPALADPAAPSGLTGREHIAVNFIEKRLSDRYPPAAHQVAVHPSLVQEQGNKERPISGNRPITVEARVSMKKEAGNILQRAATRLGRDAHSLFYVQVEEGKEPQILANLSLKPLTRAARRLGLGEKIHDVVNSTGVRQGLVAGGLGAFLANVNLPAALAAISYASVEAYKGIERRNQARSKVMVQTVDWAKRSMEQGVTPTVGEAFSTYKELLEVEKPGTCTPSIETFLHQLAIQGL